MKLGDPWAVLDMDDRDMRDYLIALDLMEHGEIATGGRRWPPVRRACDEARPRTQAELAALAAQYWAELEDANG